MGDRVENPVTPFDYKNLSLSRATKPFSQAKMEDIRVQVLQ